MTERQADQKRVEDTRALYEARANPTPPMTRLEAMTDPHASIVGPDGSVGRICPHPLAWWGNGP